MLAYEWRVCLPKSPGHRELQRVNSVIKEVKELGKLVKSEFQLSFYITNIFLKQHKLRRIFWERLLKLGFWVSFLTLGNIV
jgi:hypothetical protein